MIKCSKCNKEFETYNKNKLKKTWSKDNKKLREYVCYQCLIDQIKFQCKECNKYYSYKDIIFEMADEDNYSDNNAEVICSDCNDILSKEYFNNHKDIDHDYIDLDFRKFGFLGVSEILCQNVYKYILNNVINNKYPILITGDTGTGKEQLAKAIIELIKERELEYSLVEELKNIGRELIQCEQTINDTLITTNIDNNGNILNYWADKKVDEFNSETINATFLELEILINNKLNNVKKHILKLKNFDVKQMEENSFKYYILVDLSEDYPQEVDASKNNKLELTLVKCIKKVIKAIKQKNKRYDLIDRLDTRMDNLQLQIDSNKKTLERIYEREIITKGLEKEYFDKYRNDEVYMEKIALAKKYANNIGDRCLKELEELNNKVEATKTRYTKIKSKDPILMPRIANIGALPDDLAYSELFGHVKGAFTGAIAIRTGLIKENDEGFIVIDEIGNASIKLQNMILRYVETQEFISLGSNVIKKSNARLIFLTNCNLKDNIKNNKFKEDLYYRININHIHLPPLRERKEDIIYYTKHLIKHIYKYKDKTGNNLFPYELLYKYDWPGNTRELKSAIQYACSSEKCIKERSITSIDSFPLYIQNAINNRKQELKLTMKQAQDKWKKEYLNNVLEENDWSKTKTAKILGLTIQGLSRAMKKYNIVKL